MKPEEKRALSNEEFEKLSEDYDIPKQEIVDAIVGVPEKEEIQISLDGGRKRNVSNVCEDVAELLKDKNVLFYRPNSQQIIEIGKIKLQSSDEDFYTGFRIINEKRLVTFLEKYADFGEWKKSEELGFYFAKKSISPVKAGIILQSEILEGTLPQIERIFSVPIPILYNGKLTFPIKGFDKRFSSWRPHNSPEINNPLMEIKEAKEIINKIYSEFCFKTKQDKTNAVASLLTPFLKGLFNSFNTIIPAFFYLGNREGVGKDYCAAIPGLVIEGEHRDDNPISDGGKANNNEELRKKITSAIIHGRRRMHFANNKGYLNSGVLENLITSSHWVDRILGRNEETSYPKELDISLSGNIPIRFTPDFGRRVIFINLFYSLEDINARKFKKAHLHGWILKNREKILSALYSLVRNWIDKGQPKSSLAYASFFNWADICGGILENAGYGSPCKIDQESLSLTGDNQTIEMKSLFELCYKHKPNQPMKKWDIIELIKNDSDLFSYFNFDERADLIKFGLKLRTYLGRVLSGIKLLIADENIRVARQEFVFQREITSRVGSDGSDGSVIPQSPMEVQKSNIGSEITTNHTNTTKLSQFTDEEIKETGFSREDLENQINGKI